MQLPKTTSKRYEKLIMDVKEGQIKIPQFQRNFVWDIDKSAELLDSIMKGYPIGTFIMWRTTERLKTIGALGEFVSKEPEYNEKIQYVLDGQQRITSLFVALEGCIVEGVDYSELYVSLNAASDEKIVVTDVDDLEEGTYISFAKLLKHSLVELMDTYNRDVLQKIDVYKRNIENYDFSIIEIDDTPIEIATDIFTRINITGQALSVFEIMCAKIFDPKSGFDLSEKFDALKNELEPLNFDNIPPRLPLQLIALIEEGSCKGKTILSLKKEVVIGNWDAVCTSIKAAIDYIRATFSVPSSKLLPYDVLIIPIAYYLFERENKHPSAQDSKYLQDMFWRYSLSERYNNATEAKLATDINVVKNILEGKEYKPTTYLDLSEQYFREKGQFRIGKSITKAILCLYLHNMPLRLDSPDTKVSVDDKQLLKSNSKNYHHFFPKAFMKRKGYEGDLVDNIINIIVIDDNTNKYKIKDKAPSVYIPELAVANQEIGISLASHFVGGLDEFGISTDNYEQFFSKRCEWVVSTLNSYLCLNTVVEADDEEYLEFDLSSTDLYNAVWGQFEMLLAENSSGIVFDNTTAVKSRGATLVKAKVMLKCVLSSMENMARCELQFKDELLYQNLQSQKDAFESLVTAGRVIWSDPEDKVQKITIENKRKIDFSKEKQQVKVAEWFISSSKELKSLLDLFLEDFTPQQSLAPDKVTDEKIVYCKFRNGAASGTYLGKRIGFKVLKGSDVRLSTSARGSGEKKRKELIERGVIRRVTEALGKFEEDTILNTPSEAANLILGGSNNGWVTWQDETKQSLDVLYRKNSEVVE